MSLQRLTTGKKFKTSARSWNFMAEQAERLGIDLSGMRVPGGDFQGFDYDVVQVRNTSGQARAINHVLGLANPVRTPAADPAGFRDDNAFDGPTPSLTDHRHQFVVLASDLAANEVGEGVLTGAVWVKVNVTDATHDFATVKDGDASQLQSDVLGRARILWREPSPATGTKWCYCLLLQEVEAGPRRFKLTANLPANNTTGVAAVLRTFNGIDYVDGAAIKVFDWYAVSQGGRGMFQAITGMEGEALKREKKADTTPGAPDEYDIQWMEQYARDVECTLLGNLYPNGFTTATVTASWDQGVQPGSTITIHDDQGRWPDAIAGCKATVSRSEYADAANPTVPYYKIVSCTRAVLQAEATLDSAMCGDVPAITTLSSIAVGEHVQSVAATGQTFVNPHAHYGLAGDLVWLVRKTNTPPFTWAVRDVTKHVIPVVTSVSGGCSGIQYNYYQTVAVELCSLTTIPADVIAFKPREVMINAYEGSDAIYGQTYIIYTPCEFPGETFIIAQTTDCDGQSASGSSQPTGEEELMLLAANQEAQQQAETVPLAQFVLWYAS